jgi:hypothetical protein
VIVIAATRFGYTVNPCPDCVVTTSLRLRMHRQTVFAHDPLHSLAIHPVASGVQFLADSTAARSSDAPMLDGHLLELVPDGHVVG